MRAANYGKQGPSFKLGDYVVAQIYPHPVRAHIVAIEGEVAVLNWPDESGMLLAVYTRMLKHLPEVRTTLRMQ